MHVPSNYEKKKKKTFSLCSNSKYYILCYIGMTVYIRFLVIIRVIV